MTNKIVLYRGFNKYFADGIQKNFFRSNPRCPTNTGIFVHQVADSWFNKTFGVFARSATILCSSDQLQALKYKTEDGSMAIITPKDDFRIIYSESVVDFLDYAFCIEEMTVAGIENWLQHSNYQCVDNLVAIPPYFKGEVMIDCDSYELKNI